ncbi:hypothetical protein FE784_36765 [Paenibacillus hemerocallicola]|uniref:Uncharacterized protein n=1 Tax=Paenibacillus hemerocallicola TaxID=1172614 RepID=A0A5C4SXN0_9BACL|nr:hypothetical protein [Paenibacillus hemerocallicola]TNJ59885.1 hypothetical protein FE784_36765 [Paenibacillus hemerocallicola]
MRWVGSKKGRGDSGTAHQFQSSQVPARAADQEGIHARHFLIQAHNVCKGMGKGLGFLLEKIVSRLLQIVDEPARKFVSVLMETEAS